MSVRASPTPIIAEGRARPRSLKAGSPLDEADGPWRDRRTLSDPPAPSYTSSGSQERERGAPKLQTAGVTMTLAQHPPPPSSRGRPHSGQPRGNTAVEQPAAQHSMSSTERESQDSPARSSQVAFRMSASSNSSHGPDSQAKERGSPSISNLITENQKVRPGSAAEVEWDRIQKLRHENWSLRSEIHEMRSRLRHLQSEKSKADDILFRRLTIQGLGIGQGSYIPHGQKTLKELMDDCQQARDAYGPLEDDCNQLEDRLSAQEFSLNRLEREFYTRAPEEPSNVPDSLVSPSGDGGSQPYASSGEEEDEETDYHPLVARYLSKLGDFDLLQERLDDLLDEKRDLEEERDKRLRVGLTLDIEDQEWLDNAHHQEDELLEMIRLLGLDVEAMRENCVAQGLVDIDGEPVGFQAQEQLSFDSEKDLNPFDQQSEYVKYPLLLPTPSINSRKDIYFEPRPDVKSEINTNPNTVTSSDRYHRINEWLLIQLRGSPLDVNLLARTFQTLYGAINAPHRWQIAVLRLWFRDATMKNAASRLHVYTDSMTTQAPAISNNASFKRGANAENQVSLSHLARSEIEDDDVEIIDGPPNPKRR